MTLKLAFLILAAMTAALLPYILMVVVPYRRASARAKALGLCAICEGPLAPASVDALCGACRLEMATAP